MRACLLLSNDNRLSNYDAARVSSFPLCETSYAKILIVNCMDITTKLCYILRNTGISPFMTKRYYYCIVDIEFHGCMVYTNLSLLCQILIAFSIYFVFAPAIRFDKNYNTHFVWKTLYFETRTVVASH